MGILLRNQKTKKIIFILKGADIVMKKILKKVYRSEMSDECENMANNGLRTLVFAMKEIS